MVEGSEESPPIDLSSLTIKQAQLQLQFCSCKTSGINFKRRLSDTWSHDKRHGQMWALGTLMTIIALDGRNADDPLPGVAWYTPLRTQEMITKDGIRLVSVGEPAMDIAEKSFCRWSQRAWTTQERLLSRRRLYISEHQAYFSCLTATYSEDRHEGEHWENPYFGSVETSVLTPKPPYDWVTAWAQYIGSLYFYAAVGSRAWQAWVKCTELYSTKTSTFPEDRYNAYRGVLNGQNDEWNLSSIAGLPRTNLPQALYWDHGSRSPAFSAENVERIPSLPSWSWIGWTGRVCFTECEYTVFVPALRKLTVIDGCHTYQLTYGLDGRGQVYEKPIKEIAHRATGDLPFYELHSSRTNQDTPEKLVLQFEAPYVSVTVRMSAEIPRRV